jgi:hypothetical protein
MPFDRATWAFLLTTLSLTFVIILLVKITPKRFQTIIFGENVNMAGYNALGIFFGIGQTQMPRGNFSRMILILFIWFCLIFRTCYQSMLFEFMTTDIHRPLPQTLDDLRDLNYTVVLKGTNYSTFERDNLDMLVHKMILDGREKLHTRSEVKFFEFYDRTLSGESKKRFAYLISSWDHKVINAIKGKSLPTLGNEKLVLKNVLAANKNSIIVKYLDSVYSSFIESGIFAYLVDFDWWVIARPVPFDKRDNRRILSMSDLEFGFVLWIAAASLSLFVFICELLSLFVMRKLRNLIGLFEYLRIVKARMSVYHDVW